MHGGRKERMNSIGSSRSRLLFLWRRRKLLALNAKCRRAGSEGPWPGWSLGSGVANGPLCIDQAESLAFLGITSAAFQLFVDFGLMDVWGPPLRLPDHLCLRLRTLKLGWLQRPA